MEHTLHTQFMDEAIRLSVESVKSGGGPFGAVIVQHGKIIAVGSNKVTVHNDPTAHAEVNAIRKACEVLGTFNLSGCTLYTSCEPCPMCLGAIYWARIGTVYYGNTKADAAVIGFDDSFIYDEIEKPLAQRSIAFRQLLPQKAQQAFRLWDSATHKVKY
jgi:guanine deaminase